MLTTYQSANTTSHGPALPKDWKDYLYTRRVPNIDLELQRQIYRDVESGHHGKSIIDAAGLSGIVHGCSSTAEDVLLNRSHNHTDAGSKPVRSFYNAWVSSQRRLPSPLTYRSSKTQLSPRYSPIRSRPSTWYSQTRSHLNTRCEYDSVSLSRRSQRYSPSLTLLTSPELNSRAQSQNEDNNLFDDADDRCSQQKSLTDIRSIGLAKPHNKSSPAYRKKYENTSYKNTPRSPTPPKAVKKRSVISDFEPRSNDQSGYKVGYRACQTPKAFCDKNKILSKHGNASSPNKSSMLDTSSTNDLAREMGNAIAKFKLATERVHSKRQAAAQNNNAPSSAVDKRKSNKHQKTKLSQQEFDAEVLRQLNEAHKKIDRTGTSPQHNIRESRPVRKRQLYVRRSLVPYEPSCRKVASSPPTVQAKNREEIKTDVNFGKGSQSGFFPGRKVGVSLSLTSGGLSLTHITGKANYREGSLSDFLPNRKITLPNSRMNRFDHDSGGIKNLQSRGVDNTMLSGVNSHLAVDETVILKSDHDDHKESGLSAAGQFLVPKAASKSSRRRRRRKRGTLLQSKSNSVSKLPPPGPGKILTGSLTNSIRGQQVGNQDGKREGVDAISSSYDEKPILQTKVITKLKKTERTKSSSDSHVECESKVALHDFSENKATMPKQSSSRILDKTITQRRTKPPRSTRRKHGFVIEKIQVKEILPTKLFSLKSARRRSKSTKSINKSGKGGSRRKRHNQPIGATISGRLQPGRRFYYGEKPVQPPRQDTINDGALKHLNDARQKLRTLLGIRESPTLLPAAYMSILNPSGGNNIHSLLAAPFDVQGSDAAGGLFPPQSSTHARHNSRFGQGSEQQHKDDGLQFYSQRATSGSNLIAGPACSFPIRRDHVEEPNKIKQFEADVGPLKKVGSSPAPITRPLSSTLLSNALKPATSNSLARVRIKQTLREKKPGWAENIANNSTAVGVSNKKSCTTRVAAPVVSDKRQDLTSAAAANEKNGEINKPTSAIVKKRRKKGVVKFFPPQPTVRTLPVSARSHQAKTYRQLGLAPLVRSPSSQNTFLWAEDLDKLQTGSAGGSEGRSLKEKRSRRRNKKSERYKSFGYKKF